MLIATPVAALATALCNFPILGSIACPVLIALAVAIAAVGALLGLTDTSASPDTDDGATEIHPGQDVLFVMGTFVYDSAHQGWNELHPVLHCQKIGVSPQADVGQGQPWQSLPKFGAAQLEATIKGWCDLATDAMNPVTIEKQRRPEFGWKLHPMVDGCVPQI